MVSSTGAGDSDCASAQENAGKTKSKTLARPQFTSATVLATLESTSGILMAFEKAMNFLRQFRTDPFCGGDLFYGRLPQPVHRTKFSQEQIFPVLAHAGAIIEN